MVKKKGNVLASQCFMNIKLVEYSFAHLYLTFYLRIFINSWNKIFF